MNLLRAQCDVREVYSEITGRPVATVVETNDTLSTTLKPETIRLGPDDIDAMVGLNHFRESVYARCRSLGLSHEETIYRFFPDGRVRA